MVYEWKLLSYDRRSWSCWAERKLWIQPPKRIKTSPIRWILQFEFWWASWNPLSLVFVHTDRKTWDSCCASTCVYDTQALERHGQTACIKWGKTQLRAEAAFRRWPWQDDALAGQGGAAKGLRRGWRWGQCISSQRSPTWPLATLLSTTISKTNAVNCHSRQMPTRHASLQRAHARVYRHEGRRDSDCAL